jgi:hypothetical protein
MEKSEKNSRNDDFGAINIAGLNVVKLGNFVISDSRTKRPGYVWVRKEDTFEGGEFTIEQINETLNSMFMKYF